MTPVILVFTSSFNCESGSYDEILNFSTNMSLTYVSTMPGSFSANERKKDLEHCVDSFFPRMFMFKV